MSALFLSTAKALGQLERRWLEPKCSLAKEEQEEDEKGEEEEEEEEEEESSGEALVRRHIEASIIRRRTRETAKCLDEAKPE